MKPIEDIIYEWSQKIHQEMGITYPSKDDNIYRICLDNYGCGMNGEVQYRNGKEVKNTKKHMFRYIRDIITELLMNGYKDFNLYS